MSTDVLATITYRRPEKTISWFKQTVSTTIESLSLHANEIVSQQHRFPMETIIDCSYRPFSDGTCLFYLHTNQGIRSFHVDVDPTDFLMAYRRLRGDYFI